MTEQSAASQPAVGAAIRATREARGLSLRALAARLDVSPATLSAVERDLTPITVQRLEHVAAVLDVDTSELLTSSTTAVGPGRSPGPTRPGRPLPQRRQGTPSWRVFDSVETDPILQAATRLFVVHGFHATTVRDIAAAAGMSVAGVYHHYPSKERILVALLDFTMSEIAWRIEAARAEGRDAAHSFALMVESLALFHAVQGDLAFLGASEMRGLGRPERARVTALRDAVQHALDRQALAVIDANKESRLTPDEVRVATRAIATMCTSLPSWFKADGPKDAREVASRYARYALAILLTP
ncbi:TetR family transcriptional regulator [Hoyosella subflava]|nr:TetR family transcriptional regulator [Hoyosella subflava]